MHTNVVMSSPASARHLPFNTAGQPAGSQGMLLSLGSLHWPVLGVGGRGTDARSPATEIIRLLFFHLNELVFSSCFCAYT